MSALTDERAASQYTVKRAERPMTASVKAYKGGLAACDANGFYRPASGTATEVVVGRFTKTVDNTGGSNGARVVDIDFFRERHLLLLNNDTGTPVVVADRERSCFVKDDQTVSSDDTKGLAGIVYDVTSEGVWVEIGNQGPAGKDAA